MAHDEVLVVTGAGGMGEAVVRRIGSGRDVLLADYSQEALDRVVAGLRDQGYAVEGRVTDVSDRAALDELARAAAERGRIAAVVHTAGVSAATAGVDQMVAVDLVGTAHVIDAFEPVATPGTSLVCVASMAGHYAQLSAQEERQLATAPTDELATLPFVRALADATRAYILAKRANQLRVQAAALAWNGRGARINTVSPGVISTAMARAEAVSRSGGHMLGMLDACGIGRMGSTGELAEAVAYLAGTGSRYVTGTDLLIDGGQAAWIRWHMAD
ncbi:SDR family oxidoreductase [Nocardioides sp. NPDC101246]|uniref:SDR family oxidoreductase n=1 Tax=Nocardioides sp. NPDC101246 TaxID=3364336 RepID=UPI00380564F9